MASQELFTYQDMVERVLDLYGEYLRTNVRNLRIARMAVLNAYEDMPAHNRWTYYQRRGQVTTEASYDTGTISYDHAGGSNERQLTLTGGTWPTNAAFGQVTIGNVNYKIDSRVSATILTLSPNSNPGADVAAATSYTWWRSVYPLPVNFSKMGKLTDLSTAYDPDYESPNTFVERLRGNYTPSRPNFFTLRNAGEYFGGLSIEFGPPPSTATTYDYSYEARPRPIKRELYNTGTVDTTASSATVTGTGTNFVADMVGAVLRLPPSGSANEPTPKQGGLSVDEPYDEQRIISAVASTTSLTLHEGVTNTLSTIKYTISDPLDIESGSMMTYLQSLAEFYASRRYGASGKEVDATEARSKRKLIEAMVADSRIHDLGNIGRGRFGADLGDIAIHA